MRVLIVIIEISLFSYIFDRVCLWLERKGYLYYRKVRPKGGVVGSALQELNALLLPSNRHVIEMKQNQAMVKKSEAEGEPKT